MKMDLMWSFTIFFLCAHASQAAVVPRSELAGNLYKNLPEGKNLEYEIIEENEIANEVDSVYGLYPPKINAKDYYDSKSSYPPKGTPKEEYVIDTVNKVLKLNTDDGSHETKLKPIEETELKKLSAAFAKLFQDSNLENVDWNSQTQTESSVVQSSTEGPTEDWRKLSPIITLTKSGVSIAFGNETKPEMEEHTEMTEEKDPMRDALWGALAKSVDKVLINELDRRLNVTENKNTSVEDFPKEEDEDEEPSSIKKFISSIWNLMKSSFDYIGALFTSLISGEETTHTEIETSSNDNLNVATTTEEDENVTLPPTTTDAIFAYEEPTRYKRLPAEEFETRRRDIDSIFYGYGIV